jgi:hypothetical protein
MLEFRPLMKVMFAAGFIVGFLSGLYFSVEYLFKGEYLNSIICFIFAPILNGFFVALHGLVALPLIRIAAKNGLFGFNRISVTEQNK